VIVESEKAIVKSERLHTVKIAIALIIVLLLGSSQLKYLYGKMSDESVGNDFISYWSSGRLLLLGDNPYSIEKVFNLQKSMGRTKNYPLIMYNPPWTLTFILPFCLQNYYLSKLLWLFFNFGLVVFCADWSWRFYGGSYNNRILAVIIAFTFVPTLFVLKMGQTAPLILLGVVGFLYCEKNKYWGLAGCALPLIAGKPQLLYLFWIALLLWVFDRGKWQIIISGILTGLVITIIPLSYNFHLFNQYLNTILNVNSSPSAFQTATIGTLLRIYYGPEKQWLQFLPLFFGTIWFLVHWRRHKRTWEWTQQIPVIFLVSLMISPHAWSVDYPVLLPIIILTAIQLIQSQQTRFIKLAIVVYLIINGAALIMLFLNINECFFFWMIPALLISYSILRIQLEQKKVISA
jgi:hypothetical protein